MGAPVSLSGKKDLCRKKTVKVYVLLSQKLRNEKDRNTGISPPVFPNRTCSPSQTEYGISAPRRLPASQKHSVL